jgi:hypothetical protein
MPRGERGAERPMGERARGPASARRRGERADVLQAGEQRCSTIGPHVTATSRR